MSYVFPVIRLGFNRASGFYLFAGFVRVKGFSRVAHVLRVRTRPHHSAPNGLDRFPADLL